jgi:lipoic acid synthetase
MGFDIKYEATPSKPAWLKRRLPAGREFEMTRNLIKRSRLHTVCQEAKCPNLWECFSKKTATFLILGPRCTRNCRFCSVEQTHPIPPDAKESARIAEAVQQMKLCYVVITSVTRDDLADGGAFFFAQTIESIRQKMPDTLIEVLIPDFRGNVDALQTVLNARPDVLNHNLETVSRLYPVVRPEADYQRSLNLLRHVKTIDARIPTKSGLMLGLGEMEDEVIQTLADLRSIACDILTLGQYLQPSRKHLKVNRYVTPKEFDRLKRGALRMGFNEVASGPFVRSSYHASELFQKFSA